MRKLVRADDQATPLFPETANLRFYFYRNIIAEYTLLPEHTHSAACYFLFETLCYVFFTSDLKSRWFDVQ